MGLSRLLLAVLAALPPPGAAQSAPPAEVRPAAPSRLDTALLLADAKALASPAFEGRRPGTPGHRRAQDYVLRRLKASGLPPLARTVSLRYLVGDGGVNFAVVAKGTVHPDVCFLVTAHYDHLGVLDGRLHPGADDNASGTAAVLALAAWFRAHPPRHTLVFALFDDEERGMFGSRAFVAAAPWKPLKPRLDLNADMLSRSDRGELWISGLRSFPAWKAVFEPLAGKVPVVLRFGHDVPRRPRPDEDWSEASDHVSFVKAGIPALYVGVEDHEDYHRPTDTFERMHKDFYLRACEALLRIVEAADAAGAEAPG
ncbi:MAG: M20/M25/M40 family metallo-hydrolase [Holophagaceae bacterium]